MKKYTLGIDLHKRNSAWAIIDDERNVVWQGEVPAHPTHINITLKKLPIAAGEVQTAIEPVMGWRWVSKQLEEEGMEVHIAHPERMRLIAESRQKTDKRDALYLAELLKSGYFPEARRVSDETQRLRDIVRTRTHLVELRTATKNRIHGMVTTQGLHTVPGGNPLHKKGRDYLSKKGGLPFQELYQTLEGLDERIRSFDLVIQKEARQNETIRLLMTLPAVGYVTAVTVVAEVGDFNDFDKPEKLASFSGLVPRQRSSGERVKYGSITNAGSRHLRTTLVETAMRITTNNSPELYEFYSRLKPNTGAKRARTALARKILTVMWAVVTKGESYDPSCLSSPHREHELSRQTV